VLTTRIGEVWIAFADKESGGGQGRWCVRNGCGSRWGECCSWRRCDGWQRCRSRNGCCCGCGRAGGKESEQEYAK
jgi:hypothetical protein